MAEANAAFVLTWTPELTFMVTYFASGLCGLAAELVATDKPMTFRVVVGTLLVYGGLGSALGFSLYEVIDGRSNPLRVVACGMLVGLRVVKPKDVKTIIKRILGGSDGNNDSSTKP